MPLIARRSHHVAAASIQLLQSTLARSTRRFWLESAFDRVRPGSRQVAKGKNICSSVAIIR